VCTFGDSGPLIIAALVWFLAGAGGHPADWPLQRHRVDWVVLDGAAVRGCMYGCGLCG